MKNVKLQEGVVRYYYRHCFFLQECATHSRYVGDDSRVSLQVEEAPSKLYRMPKGLKLCSAVTIISRYGTIISLID
jgi:hypothetical protein